MAQQAFQVDFTQTINELANRLRVLESKQNTFAEKLLVMNQNMIDEYQKIIQDMKHVRQEIVTVKGDLDNAKNVVKHLAEEAGKFARQDDVKVLQKYVDYWNPIKFVTDKEVMQMIEKAMGQEHVEVRETEAEIVEEPSLSIEDALNLAEKDHE